MNLKKSNLSTMSTSLEDKSLNACNAYRNGKAVAVSTIHIMVCVSVVPVVLKWCPGTFLCHIRSSIQISDTK